MTALDPLLAGRDELLTVEEVAQLVKRTKRWVYDAGATGQLPKPIKVGQQLRFRRSDINTWLQEASA